MRASPILLLPALLIAACTGSSGEPGVGPCHDADGDRFDLCRVFRGRLKLPPPKQMHLTTMGLQLAAVAFEPTGGAPAPTPKPDGGASGDGAAGMPDSAAAIQPTDKTRMRLFFGPVVAHDEGAGQRPDVPFSVVVPCGMSVNLVLQVPRSSSSGSPGLWVTALAFAAEDGAAVTATLVPKQPDDLCGSKTNSLDMGDVQLTLAIAGVLASGSITLGKDNSRNPLSLLDTDGDGTDNLADLDDDDDGQSDIGDLDADGDGVLDSAESLTALPDQDSNGVPDLFQ